MEPQQHHPLISSLAGRKDSSQCSNFGTLTPPAQSTDGEESPTDEEEPFPVYDTDQDFEADQHIELSAQNHVQLEPTETSSSDLDTLGPPVSPQSLTAPEKAFSAPLKLCLEIQEVDHNLEPLPIRFVFEQGTRLLLGRSSTKQRLPAKEGAQAVHEKGRNIGLFTNQVISKEHASIVQDKGQLILEDLGSTHGTYVNGSRVSRCSLVDGDQVTLGRKVIRRKVTYKALDLDLRIYPDDALNSPSPLSEITQAGVPSTSEPHDAFGLHQDDTPSSEDQSTDDQLPLQDSDDEFLARQRWLHYGDLSELGDYDSDSVLRGKHDDSDGEGGDERFNVDQSAGDEAKGKKYVSGNHGEDNEGEDGDMGWDLSSEQLSEIQTVLEEDSDRPALIPHAPLTPSLGNTTAAVLKEDISMESSTLEWEVVETSILDSSLPSTSWASLSSDIPGAHHDLSGHKRVRDDDDHGLELVRKGRAKRARATTESCKGAQDLLHQPKTLIAVGLAGVVLGSLGTVLALANL